MAPEEVRGDVKTVVIVGAGAAGLQAANVLLKSSAYRSGQLKVIILEARDRVGGRILIERRWSVPFDCGTYLIDDEVDNRTKLDSWNVLESSHGLYEVFGFGVDLSR